MLELDHLTVSGDVTFGKDVVLKVSCINVFIFSLNGLDHKNTKKNRNMNIFSNRNLQFLKKNVLILF